MKKLIYVGLFLLISVSTAYSQSLNSNATYIRNNFEKAYTNTIRKHAIEKWDSDHEMIVYTINKQSDALFEIINDFKSEYTNILFQSVKEWSKDGYLSSNIEKFKDINVVNIKNLIVMHCDWEMVKYNYDKQAKAKSAY